MDGISSPGTRLWFVRNGTNRLVTQKWIKKLETTPELRLKEWTRSETMGENGGRSNKRREVRLLVLSCCGINTLLARVKPHNKE
jgi:hypothetical protein